MVWHINSDIIIAFPSTYIQFLQRQGQEKFSALVSTSGSPKRVTTNGFHIYTSNWQGTLHGLHSTSDTASANMESD